MEVASVGSERLPLGGRTCFVTGATSGIGEITAGRLAALGARVFLSGRDPERGEAAIGRIRQRSPTADVRLFTADLARMAEVRRLAAEVRAAAPGLDVLVNNAGAVQYTYSTTPEGVERTWALNVLAPFLLTELLLGSLAPARGRVVNVASSAHRGAKIRWDDLGRSLRYSAFGAYGQSKLALIALTYEAARRHAGIGVTFNACHPGFIRSRFGDEGGTTTAQVFRVLKGQFGGSPERGATTPTFLASAPGVERTTGEYFVHRRAHRSSRASRDPETARRLWEICLAQTAPYRADAA